MILGCRVSEGRTRSQTENSYRCIRPLNLIEYFGIGFREMARREPEEDERSGLLGERDGDSTNRLRAAASDLILTG